MAIKSVEKECGGLERFVPTSLTESMKKKELRKLLTHFLKLNSNLVSHGQKFLTGLQAKLHYLKIISELPSYGAKCFSTNLSVSQTNQKVFELLKFLKTENCFLIVPFPPDRIEMIASLVRRKRLGKLF